jgi:murein DD-endopeptidase MepM/ murein hydrolase activator NlpD
VAVDRGGDDVDLDATIANALDALGGGEYAHDGEWLWRAAFNQKAAGVLKRTTGGEHRVEYEHGASIESIGKLREVRVRVERFLISGQPDEPNFGLRYESQRRVHQADAGPQHRHEHGHMCELAGVGRTKWRGDRGGDRLQMSGGFVDQHAAKAIEGLAKVAVAGSCVTQDREPFGGEGMVDNANVHDAPNVCGQNGEPPRAYDVTMPTALRSAFARALLAPVLMIGTVAVNTEQVAAAAPDPRPRPIVAGSPRRIPIAGSFGVPATARVVAVNVTAVAPPVATYVTVWPSGTVQPTTSSLNVSAGVTAANLVVSGLGVDGALSVAIGDGYGEVLVDVVGWFDQTSALKLVSPERRYDTRRGAGRLLPKVARTVVVAPSAGSAAAASSAVLLNLTAAGPSDASFLTVYPTGTARPLASNLNTRANEDVANLVIAEIGVGGAVDIYNDAGSTDVVVDVVGYLSSTAGFQSVTPNRVLDSRSGKPFGAADERAVRVNGPAASVAIVNLTATVTTSDSFVTTWSSGARPVVSSLNPRVGGAVANLAFVPTSSGEIRLFNSVASSHLIVDLVGFLPASAGFHAVAPVRAFDSRPDVVSAASTVRHGFVVPAGTNVAYARTHSGYSATDVFAPCGTPILAPVDGVVSEVRRVDAYSPAHPATFGGRSVAVVGDDGVRYYGSHFDTIGTDIVPGHRVVVGEQLGTMGRTGDTTVCHLHFGLSIACPGPEWSVRRGVVWPWPYLDAWRSGTNLSPAAELADWRDANLAACITAMADPDAANASGP